MMVDMARGKENAKRAKLGERSCRSRDAWRSSGSRRLFEMEYA